MPKAMFFVPVELAPGKSDTDLEKFWLEEYLPNVKELPGYRSDLLKGIQGVRKSQYVLVGHFESNERENELFPPVNGGPSAGGSEEWKRWTEANPVQQELLSFFDTKWFGETTSYHGIG